MAWKKYNPMTAEAQRGLSLLLVEVEFGVPSRQCVNYGICRIELAQGYGWPKSSGCRHCGSLALASAPGLNQLELAFLTTSLNEASRNRHFECSYFLVEEAYVIPPSLCLRLGLPISAVGPGEYQISEKEHFLVVRFSALVLLE